MLMPLIFNGLLLSTSVTANTALKDNIPYLVTHGDALGVASKFNVFALNDFGMSNPISNVRVSARLFSSSNNHLSIGWTSEPTFDVDGHMLVVKNRVNDINTDSTYFDTTDTSGYYAAEDADAKPMKNKNDVSYDSSFSMARDPLSTVQDFTENGVSTFDEADTQLKQVSDFYASKTELAKAFSANFLNYTELDADQIKELSAGNTVTISAKDAAQQLLVINIPVTKIQEIKPNLFRINIKYLTQFNDENKKPIVIFNFPNLTEGFDFNQNGNQLNVSYGSEDSQKMIDDKQHLVLNFPNLKDQTIGFDNQFLGTLIAPQANIRVNSLNEHLTSVVGRNVQINNQVTSDGPSGIFNPDEFSDEKNHADTTPPTEDSKMEAHVQKTDTAGHTTSTAIDDLKDLGYFTYNDQADFDFKWSGYDHNAKLYRRDDSSAWVQVGKDSTATDGSGDYNSSNETFYPAQKLSWSISSSQTLIAQSSKTVHFALATANPGDTDSKILWNQDVSLPLAKFSLTVPATIDFSNLDADTNGVIKPTTMPQIKVNNALDAPFNLKLIVDAQSSGNSPTDSSNIFLGVGQFTFNNADLNNLTAILGMNQESADQFIKDMATAPLEETDKTYDLTGFRLNTHNQRFVAATAGLKWQFDWGSE